MKRSEAINVIANYFYENNVDPEEADELGEEVLSKLEEMGMLPPEQQHQIDEGIKLGFKGIVRVSELEWEPEED